MDAESKLKEWNDAFLIAKGHVVCTRCLRTQPMSSAGSPFPHQAGCRHISSTYGRPWIALHNILDQARG